MAFDLVARFSIQDKMSAKIRGITQQVQQLNNAMKQVTQVTRSMNNAQQRTSSIINNNNSVFNRNTSIVNNNSSSVVNNLTQINRYSSAASKMTSSIQSQSSAIGSLKSQLLGIGTAFLSAQGLANGFGNFTDAADSYSNISARLANVNDGLQTQAQLQDKIFKASQRSRSSYDIMASSVAKLNLLAKDAFSNNDEAIKFTELMTKSFAVSGAGAQEMKSGMYQLTQALSSGKLQGDEFRSIMENAPLLAQAISKTANVSMGELKKMSSEGTITSDLIKKSLFNAAEEIEEKFAKMPMTFSQAMTLFKSSAKRVFEPLFNQFISFVNSETFAKLESQALSFVQKAANGLSRVFSAVKSLYKVWQTIGPVVTKVAKVIGTFVAVVGGIFAIVGAVKLVGAAFAFIASPIGLIAAGITAVGLGFVAAYRHFKPFRDGVQNGLQKIKDFVTTFKQAMKGGLLTGILDRDKTAVALAVTAANTVKKIGKQIQKVKDFIVTTKQVLNGGLLTGIMDRDKNAVAGAVAFATNLKAAFKATKEVIGPVVATIKEKFSEMKSAFDAGGMGGLLSSILPPGMYEKIVDFVNTIRTQIGEVIPFLKEKFDQIKPSFDILMQVFTKIRDTVMEVFPAIWAVIEPILTNVWSVIKRVADIATWAFGLIIVPVLANVGVAFQNVWAILGPILEFIGAAIKLAFGALQVVWDNILAPFAGFLMGAFAEAINFVMPLIDGIGIVFETIGSMISFAAEKLSGFADKLKSINVPDWMSKVGSGVMNFASNIFTGGKKGSTDGTHYNGIGRIPFDNYLATLHAGERVLNRFEADQYDSILSGDIQGAGVSDFKYESGRINNTTINNSNTTVKGSASKGEQLVINSPINLHGVTIREDADIQKIGMAVTDMIVSKVLERRGVTI